MASRAIKKRHNVKKKTGKVVAISMIAVIIAAVGALAFGASAMAKNWLSDLPDYSNTDQFNKSATSVVYASDGTTVLAEFQLENREPVTLDQVSEYVIEGTVATEDERFYSHTGVDMQGMVRALANNMFGGALEGGSTITQQLVRNTVLSEEMQEISLKRKLREMYIATKVEETYDKDEILLMYLNTINYGSGAYGIQAAAERYFSKPASELTLAEAAMLIGIPQSPTYNNPIDHPDNCLIRRNLVLDRMVKNGYITQEDADVAKQEEIVLNPTKPSVTGIKAYPYFTSYVRNQLMSQTGKYAFSKADVFGGGLKIITTLDVNDQIIAEEEAAERAAEAGDGFEVALAAVDPANGFIKALVGGNNYDEEQVNMATGEGSSGRQVGSSFKTFTLLAALEEGINPDTKIDAGLKVELPGTDKEVYNVNHANYGTKTIEEAFAVSSNTAFTRLILSLGVDKVKTMAKKLGIKSPLQDVAGITLGIDSLTPLEMADAYATIANGGTYYAPECIYQVIDRDGNVIVDNSNPQGERVISEEVACAAIKVMEGVVTSGTGKAAALANGQPVAGKTGTTEEKKDSWFVGFTPQLSVALWLGDRVDNYAQARSVNGTVAAVFANFMNRVLEGQPIVPFPVAADPTYMKSYVDAKNHIGGNYGKGTTEDAGDGTEGSTGPKVESEDEGSSSGSGSSGEGQHPSHGGNEGSSSGNGDGDSSGNSGSGNSGSSTDPGTTTPPAPSGSEEGEA